MKFLLGLIDFVVKLAKKIKKTAPEVKFILSSTSKQQVVIKCFTSLTRR